MYHILKHKGPKKKAKRTERNNYKLDMTQVQQSWLQRDTLSTAVIDGNTNSGLLKKKKKEN